MTEAKTLELRVVDGEVARSLDPEGIQWPDASLVLYALEGDRVVGRAALLELAHIEGMWLAEDKKNGTLGVRIMQKIEEMLKLTGRTHGLAFAHKAQPLVGDYLERLGYEKLPLEMYGKELA